MVGLLGGKKKPLHWAGVLGEDHLGVWEGNNRMHAYFLVPSCFPDDDNLLRFSDGMGDATNFLAALMLCSVLLCFQYNTPVRLRVFLIIRRGEEEGGPSDL